ncbi:unnamed protein product, partial [Dovyalis caffra]
MPKSMSCKNNIRSIHSDFFCMKEQGKKEEKIQKEIKQFPCQTYRKHSLPQSE